MKKIQMDYLDLQLIRAMQEGIELAPQPYRSLGEELKISEDEVIERIKVLVDRGLIRRFAATIGHRALGIVANAMIVWNVPPENINQVGRVMASFDEVTHCYERPLHPDWPYNLYTMVHSHSKERCKDISKNISQRTGIKDYQIIFSEKEFKKTGAKI